jgi:transcription termination/antitermination protein NusG
MMMSKKSQEDSLFPVEHIEEVDEEETFNPAEEEASLDFSMEIEDEADDSANAKHGYQAEEMPQGTQIISEGTASKRKRWYIIHTYSGHENKVKINLERRVESMNMQEKIFRVEVPQKPVTKIKDGKRIEKDEHLFPSYVLVEMIMDDNSWYCVRYTPGVTKFVGGEKKPIPARDSEIKKILMRNQSTKQKVEVDLKAGDTIQVISGPFSDFEGTVTEVQPDKERLKATISIFGRETPVELVFSQVQKRVN